VSSIEFVWVWSIGFFCLLFLKIISRQKLTKNCETHRIPKNMNSNNTVLEHKQQRARQQHQRERLAVKVYNTNLQSIEELKQKKQHIMSQQVYSLSLLYNKINEISALEDFVYLVELNLCSNNISQIKGLNTLTQLVVLNLSGNKVCAIETPLVCANTFVSFADC